MIFCTTKRTFALAALLVVGSFSHASGATKYWDLNGTTDGAGSATPSGTWNAATANWNLDPDGDADAGPATTWTAGDIAVFSAGTDATGTFTVTVSGSQSIAGIIVEEGNPTINSNTFNVANGSSFNIASGSRLTLGTLLSLANGGGANQVTKDGDGILVLNGNSTGFAARFVLNTGTVGVGNNGAFGTSAGNSTLTIAGGNISASGGTRTLSGSLTTNLSGDFSVGGPVGTNQLNFDGIVTIGDSNRIITVASDTVLQFQNTLGEDVAGRELTKQGGGTMRFETTVAEAANGFTGNFTVAEGKIEVSGAGIIGNSGTPPQIIFSGGSMNTTANRSQPIANPIQFTVPTLITTTSVAGTVGLDFSSNNITGTSPVTFRNDGADSDTDTFEPRFNYSVGDSSFNFPIVVDNGIGKTRLASANTGNTTQTIDGVISGTGGFARSAAFNQVGGTTLLTAANLYSGDTAVTDGTLRVNNTMGSGTGTGNVVVGNNISGSADVGTLGGSGTISGVVTVNYNGILAPGNSVGLLTVGGLTLNAGESGTQATANFELDTVAASDRINVTIPDGLTIDDVRFNITGLGGFGAGIYTLIDYSGTLMGSATIDNSLLLTTPGGPFTYSLVNNVGATAIQLQVAAIGGDFAGDFNDDGIVDAADYVMWRHGDVDPNFQLANDSASPGIQPEDYDVWAANFGNEEGGGGADGSPVPEPASFILLGMGVAALGWRRRTA